MNQNINNNNNNNDIRFIAIKQINLQQTAPLVKNWRILLV